MATFEGEVRFLSIRSLRTRWDCGRSTVYAHLAKMRQLGLYAGFQLGADQRVALSAVERYEERLAKGTTDPDRGRLAAVRAGCSPPRPASDASQHHPPDRQLTAQPADRTPLRQTLRAMYRAARTQRGAKR